jgi:hypothetical protein
MRLVFGDGLLVLHDNQPCLQFIGLQTPATILPSLTGQAVPDLSAYVGKVLHFSGELEAPGENLELPRFHWSEFRVAPDGYPHGCATAVVTGNLGKAPEANPKADRFTASLAFHSVLKVSSWVRLTALSDYGFCPFFEKLEAGVRMLAAGVVESYTSQQGNARLQVNLRSFQMLGGAGYKPPERIASSFAASETHVAVEPDSSEVPF